MELELKKDISLKESYEKISTLVRFFIDKNDKKLKEEHYHKNFAYYSFSNFYPLEKDMLYKKGQIYTVELRSLKEEFLDLKKYKGLETDSLQIVSVNSGKLYYGANGHLQSETPVFFNTKKIVDELYEREVKEKIRENVLFRYVKSGINTSDGLENLRETVLKDISIDRKVITIPFEEKKLRNGKTLLYHCFHVKLEFQDNEIAKEVEKVIYAGGIGMNTSNGFGLMRT